MKNISILGSTGSIGKNTLDVIRHLGEGYQVKALAAHSNIALLKEQIDEFHPELVAVFEPKAAETLRQQVKNVPILSGMEGLLEVARFSSSNFVLSAMAGTRGLLPTLEAIKASKDVGLANKEALVSGGYLVMQLVKEKGIRLLPVDSEHSAIFQCLQGNEKKAVQRLIITASGGPFRNFSQDALREVTLDQALNHPNWKMGPKITIDSSTLMNKGLEVIEAFWLFEIPLKQIEVVIHPQSAIHSLVEFIDGSMMAQMGEPSMTVPIQYALTYPERKPGMMKPFDFIRFKTLEFSFPDLDRFSCLRLAYDAIGQGGSLPCYMNAANEVLVGRFLEKQIAWTDIALKLEILMQRHKVVQVDSSEIILEIDKIARLEAAKI